MKFSEMPYKRPDLDSVKQRAAELTDALKSAATFENADETFLLMQELLKGFLTASALVKIRHDIDTNDALRREQAFFDYAGPDGEYIRIGRRA